MGKTLVANYYAILIKRNAGYTLDDVPDDIIDDVKQRICELDDKESADTETLISE